MLQVVEPYDKVPYLVTGPYENQDLRDTLLSPIPGAAPALFLKKFIGRAAIPFSADLLERSQAKEVSLSFFFQSIQKLESLLSTKMWHQKYIFEIHCISAHVADFIVVRDKNATSKVDTFVVVPP